MSNYSVCVSKYRVKSGRRYRLNYRYISPVDGKVHLSSKGGFKCYRDVRYWLENEYHQFLFNLENGTPTSSKGGAVR